MLTWAAAAPTLPRRSEHCVPLPEPGPPTIPITVASERSRRSSAESGFKGCGAIFLKEAWTGFFLFFLSLPMTTVFFSFSSSFE
jgi:hypothetical protein